MKTFFTGSREIYGPKLRGLTQRKAMDDETVLQEKDKILDRFSDHFDQLLNNPRDLSEEAKEALVQQSVVWRLDEPPNFDELMSSAIRTTQDVKAPGRDGIPAEVLWNFGGVQLTNCLYKLIQEIWECPENTWRLEGCKHCVFVQERWQEGLWKLRSISQLATNCKIHSRVLLNRRSEHISQNVQLPETQYGFRSGRSTMDLIFCLKQVQEKSIEQNMSLYVVFIDFSKAFDIVSRQGLWQVLKKYGCTEKFVSLIEALHTGMQANVAMCGSVSTDFSESNGVKQGCVLAPTVFSLYLAACLRWPSKTLQGVCI